MLRKRIIPIIAINGFSVIKTEKFNVRRNLGSPVTVVNTYNSRNVDELVLIDLDASKRKEIVSPALIKHISKHCFMPLTVGGGVTSLEGFEALLRSGADKVTINTAALNTPQLIKQAAMQFGKQCVVVSVDIQRNDDNQFQIYSNGKIVDNNIWDWLKEIQSLGAGELLIQSVNSDGTLCGPDLELISTLVKHTSIPVIYSGGIGTIEHAVDALKEDISGLGVTSLFQFTGITPNDIKQEAWKQNIAVRV